MLEHAQWIACKDYETPILLRQFSLEDWSSARLCLTGLGYFEAYINGQRLTEDLFLPAQTDYQKRDTAHFNYPILDKIRYRIHYLQYDIAPYLRRGNNTLHILLGNGWYRQILRTAEGHTSYGAHLKALYQLEIATSKGNVQICSDGSERYGASPILESNLFRGEVIDARQPICFDRQVQRTRVPNSQLILQQCPADRVISQITPRLLFREGDTCIFDNGVNVTGQVAVTVCCPAGEEITLEFSENLNSSQTDLDPASTGQLQQDRFISDGRQREFRPRFVYHCFRYFKIRGPFQEVKTLVIHTDVPAVSQFTSDNPTLNWLYTAFQRTFLNNLHGAVPSDCPHRERLGYTGDGQITAEAAMYCFDLSGAYRKWIRDIFDGQGENGHIQHTAPFQGGGGGPACWGGAAIMLPYQYYRFYGDKTFLDECYPGIRKWIDYMRSRAENGCIVREEPGGWCLGDWGSHTTPAIDPAFVNTAFFVNLLQLAETLAAAAGKPRDIPLFQTWQTEHKTALMARFYDPVSGDFCGNVQFANVFGLAIGLGKEETFAHVCQAVDTCGTQLDIGIQAMDLLIFQLFRQGEPDRALRAMEILLHTMIERGATTVWEYPYRQELSNCHHMFCGMVRCLFSELLGIRLQPDGRIEFAAPSLPTGMTRAQGETVLRGKRIQVTICREQENLHCSQIIETIHGKDGSHETVCKTNDLQSAKSATGRLRLPDTARRSSIGQTGNQQPEGQRLGRPAGH